MPCCSWSSAATSSSRNLGSDKPDTAPAGASGDYGMVVGDADAPKSIVIYEDFLCPFCGQLEQTVGDQLDAAVEAGEVNVEYRPLPFLERISDYSPEAANAFAVVLDESGPEVAKAFHDLLFDNQPSESGPVPRRATSSSSGPSRRVPRRTPCARASRT